MRLVNDRLHYLEWAVYLYLLLLSNAYDGVVVTGISNEVDDYYC